MADWVPAEEDGFGVMTGAGSSLSSSSSTRVASASTNKALFLFNQSMPTTDNDPPSSLKQKLTHLDPLALNIGLLVESLTGLYDCWCAAGDLTLRHAKVLQQSGNLALEVHAAGVLQHRDQVQLQVLAHTAHLRLSQSRGQVS